MRIVIRWIVNFVSRVWQVIVNLNPRHRTDIFPPDLIQPEGEGSKSAEAVRQSALTHKQINSIDNASYVGEEGKAPDELTREQVRPSHQKRRRVAPIDRGGRPRGQNDTSVTRAVQKKTESKRPSVIKPELVCWKQGMSWILGVEVSEELEDANVKVRQGVLLDRDSQRSLCYPLRVPLGEVQVVWENKDEEQEQYIFSQEPYRIFKLTGDLGMGRRMNRVTRGRFLITVPDSWQRDEDLSGPEFLAAEPILSAPLTAHHFEVDGESVKTAVFLKPEGEKESVPSHAKEVELRGERVVDAEREAGYLFVGEPPDLRLLGKADYATVVVGEEGLRQNGDHWRSTAKRFDELRANIRERGAGWYFVRLYDSDDQLIESLDFRYSKGLKGVRLDAESPLSDIKGHGTASISFCYNPPCSIETVEKNPQLKIEHRDKEARVTVPPEARFDRTLWTILEPENRFVKVNILVERIWWALSDEGHDVPETAWTDQSFTLAREDLVPTSIRTIHVRLPIAGWATDVRIGFRKETAYKLQTSPRQAICTLFLRNLGGQIAAIEVQEQPALKLWVWPKGFSNSILEGIVAWIRTPKKATDAVLPKPLFLGNLRPPKLMSVLNRYRYQLPRSARNIIGDFRRMYYCSARRGGTKEQSVFLGQGLCLLAALMQLVEGEKCPNLKLRVPARWIYRAYAARRQFPEDFIAWEAQLRHRAQTNSPRTNQILQGG